MEDEDTRDLLEKVQEFCMSKDFEGQFDEFAVSLGVGGGVGEGGGL